MVVGDALLATGNKLPGGILVGVAVVLQHKHARGCGSHKNGIGIVLAKAGGSAVALLYVIGIGGQGLEGLLLLVEEVVEPIVALNPDEVVVVLPKS